MNKSDLKYKNQNGLRADRKNHFFSKFFFSPIFYIRGINDLTPGNKQYPINRKRAQLIPPP